MGALEASLSAPGPHLVEDWARSWSMPTAHLGSSQGSCPRASAMSTSPAIGRSTVAVQEALGVSTPGQVTCTTSNR
jgi:hypothetical protein